MNALGIQMENGTERNPSPVLNEGKIHCYLITGKPPCMNNEIFTG
jgi:hypothetical protein